MCSAFIFGFSNLGVVTDIHQNNRRLNEQTVCLIKKQHREQGNLNVNCQVYYRKNPNFLE